MINWKSTFKLSDLPPAVVTSTEYSNFFFPNQGVLDQNYRDCVVTSIYSAQSQAHLDRNLIIWHTDTARLRI